MPALTGDALGVRIGMHRQDLRMPFRAWCIRMNMQFAKQAPKSLVLIEGQLLIAKEQHLMRHQRVVHLLELLVAQLFAQVDAANLRADRGRDRLHVDSLIGHGWRSSRFFAWSTIPASRPACPAGPMTSPHASLHAEPATKGGSRWQASSGMPAPSGKAAARTARADSPRRARR